jgi:hypothetical protein
MPFYLVEVREVHISLRRVWAENEAEALHDGAGGEELTLEYSHTLDQDTFTVELDTDQTGDPV